MQKVGVTNLLPLNEISAPRFGCIGKDLWVICYELFFMLPGSFVFDVVTPLYFAHLDDYCKSLILLYPKFGLASRCMIDLILDPVVP
jgi:hypothetical protein